MEATIMIFAAKIWKTGNSHVITIPDGILIHGRLLEGDSVTVRITRPDDHFLMAAAEIHELAEEISRHIPTCGTRKQYHRRERAQKTKKV